MNGNTLTTPATQASAAFATNFRGAMELDWQLSTKTGDEEWTEWISTGLKSDNRVYILRQEPAAQTILFETVLDIACTRVPVHEGESSVVAAIWGKFGTLNVNRKLRDGFNVKDGTLMTYQVYPNPANHLSELLRSTSADATCQAWTELLFAAVHCHGVVSTMRFITPKPDAEYLYVRNWQFKGNGSGGDYPYVKGIDALEKPGARAQANLDPMSVFGCHYVVEIDSKIYDPSYGFRPCSKLEHQVAAFAGVGKDQDTRKVVRPINQLSFDVNYAPYTP